MPDHLLLVLVSSRVVELAARVCVPSIHSFSSPCRPSSLLLQPDELKAKLEERMHAAEESRDKKLADVKEAAHSDVSKAKKVAEEHKSSGAASGAAGAAEAKESH